MTSEKLIALAKRWTLLEAQQKDLDYNKAQWAREARGCFLDDRRFIIWCKSDLGLRDAQAQDLCLLARAAGIVPDAKMWSALGGSKQIRAVEDLTKRQQVGVLETAKTTGRAVRTIVRELYPSAAPEREIASGKMSDLAVLSQFISEHLDALPRLPSDVEVIVRMYAPMRVRRAS